MPREAETAVEETGIAGCVLVPLKVISTPDGAVMHMLRPGLPLLPREQTDAGEPITVGEVYFSEVLPGHVKAWKRHTCQTQHFCVPVGRLGIALYDARPGSSSKGMLRTLVLGREDAYCLLRIPCGIWYGFTALGDAPAVICNAADIPHDPTEGRKCAPGTGEAASIPFDWNDPFPQ